MSNKIILKAEDLDGYLTSEDLADLKKLDGMFKETMKFFEPVNKEKIIEGFATVTSAATFLRQKDFTVLIGTPSF